MSEQVLGLVLNDGHGLCLKAEGDLAYAAKDQKNGFFTCIAEKAIDLGEDETDADAELATPAAGDEQPLPTVRLETSVRSLLITKFESGGRERTLVVSKPRFIAEDE